MSGLVHNLTWNALEASLLALLVVAVVRFTRLSAPVRHMLWFIVLLKLLAPPLAVHSIGLSAGCARAVERVIAYARTHATKTGSDVRLPFLVSDLSLESVESTSTASIVEDGPAAIMGEREKSDAAVHDGVSAMSVEGSDTDAASAGRNRLEDKTFARPLQKASIGDVAGASVASWIRASARARDRLLFWGWLTGAVCLAAIRLRQSLSIFRMLRVAEPARARVIKDCKALAEQIGIRYVPSVRVIARSVSPTVCVLGKSTIVLPVKLTEGSGRAVIRSVLAHELAHLKRRDHWICWLELIAGCAYWWLPPFWWACRAMRRAADEAADAWAVEILGCRQTYAESLLETVDLLVAGRAMAPVWGAGRSASATPLQGD